MTRLHEEAPRRALELRDLVDRFASGLEAADARRPQAVGPRSGRRYQPGVGPHSERATIELVTKEWVASGWVDAADLALEVSYPKVARAKCDLCLGRAPDWEWCIEAKLLRLVGDNGKPNDNMLMHILSPYPKDRSALTDCEKLLNSGFQGRKAILVFGYEHQEWPLNLAIEAFETLAKLGFVLTERVFAPVSNLIHPVHSRGGVFGWEVLRQAGPPPASGPHGGPA